MAGSYLLTSIDYDHLAEFSAALKESSGLFKLTIASEGGDTDVMWAFVDLILCSKREFIGTAYGVCHSAAPLILASCDQRFCGPNTQFMVHEDIIELSGSPSSSIKQVNRAQAEEDRWYTAMSIATGTPITEWRKMSESETYFDAQKAKELGLVDKILLVDTKGKGRKHESQ